MLLFNVGNICPLYATNVTTKSQKEKESFENCHNTGSSAFATVQQKQTHEQSTFDYNQTRNRILLNITIKQKLGNNNFNHYLNMKVTFELIYN